MTERLLDRGDRVAATVRRDDALADLQKKHLERLSVMKLDLTDSIGIRATVDQAFRRLGRIDVVVSNAAYGLVGAAEELTDMQIDRQIATNLTGSIQLIRAVLPHLRQQGGGRIVQVSSEGGQMAYPSFSLYHATKWGIEGRGPPASLPTRHSIDGILDVPVLSKSSKESAKLFNWLTPFIEADNPGSSRLTQERLRWRPTLNDIVSDLLTDQLRSQTNLGIGPSCGVWSGSSTKSSST
jgi:short chain dehydrogenase